MGIKVLSAEIQPLRATKKYYGTTILVHFRDGDSEGSAELKIWVMGNGEPSIREKKLVPQDEQEFCDSHYETKASYELSKKVVRGLLS